MSDPIAPYLTSPLAYVVAILLSGVVLLLAGLVALRDLFDHGSAGCVNYRNCAAVSIGGVEPSTI